MKKALIVYHSRSGHTRRVAQALAQRLDADLEEIRIVQPLDGWLGYAMCAIESLAELTPALRPMRKDPGAYYLVIIGTPVWFWNIASPVRSWLATHPLKRRVAFFCTMGGSGFSRAFAAMSELAGREPAATLALIDHDVDANVGDRLDTFAGALRAERPRRRKRAAHARPALAAA